MTTINNRPEIRIVENITSSPNIAAFNIRSGTIISTFDTFIPAIFSGIAGFVAGATAGALFLAAASERLALAGILGWLSYNGFYFLDRWLSAPRYSGKYWDGELAIEEPEPLDGFMPTAHGLQMRLLTGRMRSLLHRFAAHYEEIGTMAIGAWYKSKYLNRSQIEDIRDYLTIPTIGAAVRGTDGVVLLTEWGRSQLPKWAANDFSDVIELMPAPPTPTAGR